MLERTSALTTADVDHHDLTTFDVADIFGAEQIERAGLAADDPRAVDAADRQRPESVWITCGDQTTGNECDQ